MTSRERVLTVVERRLPDRTPADYKAEPEVNQYMLKHLKVNSYEELLKRLKVLNPVQPECLDLVQVKKQFGDRLVFWGGIGTQTTMPFATPEELYRTVQQTIGVLGPTGCFPCPTHVLEPEVPWENILAFLRAVEEYHFP